MTEGKNYQFLPASVSLCKMEKQSLLTVFLEFGLQLHMQAASTEQLINEDILPEGL